MLQMKLVAAAIGVTATLAASYASAAATVYINDPLEYANQGAFDAAWPVIGTAAAVLTAQTGTSTGQYAAVPATPATNRSGQTVAELGNPSSSNVVTFSFDFLDSDASLSPYRQYSNLQDGTAPSGAGQLVSMGLNNNQTSAQDGGNYYMARILGGDGGTGVSAYFKLNDAGAPLRSTGWHNLKVTISDTAYTFFVDGIQSQTVANTAAMLRSYDTVRLGSGVTSTAASGFDNFYLATDAAVPEPTTVAALGAAGLLLGRRRKA